MVQYESYLLRSMEKSGIVHTKEKKKVYTKLVCDWTITNNWKMSPFLLWSISGRVDGQSWFILLIAQPGLCVLWFHSSWGQFYLPALSSQVCTNEKRIRKQKKPSSCFSWDPCNDSLDPQHNSFNILYMTCTPLWEPKISERRSSGLPLAAWHKIQV